MKPLLGITPVYDGERGREWLRVNYCDLFEEAGAIPLVLSFDIDRSDVEREVDVLDGIVFVGGADVDPSLYGERRVEECGDSSPKRDEFESLLFDVAHGKDKPIFGICRGCQFINVKLGGTLWQDISSQRPASYDHRMPDNYASASHLVEIIPDTPLHDAVHTTSFPVNSIHHQGIKAIANDLRAMAYATDGLVESVWEPGRTCVWGVQWHPEYAFREEPRQLDIARAFVGRCQEAMGERGL